jgi:hypothetical protein
MDRRRHIPDDMASAPEKDESNMSMGEGYLGQEYEQACEIAALRLEILSIRALLEESKRRWDLMAQGCAALPVPCPGKQAYSECVAAAPSMNKKWTNAALLDIM